MDSTVYYELVEIPISQSRSVNPTAPFNIGKQSYIWVCQSSKVIGYGNVNILVSSFCLMDLFNCKVFRKAIGTLWILSFLMVILCLKVLLYKREGA